MLLARRSLARRALATAAPAGGAARKRPAGPPISVTFVKPDGSRVTVQAPLGDSMLEVAHANKIDIEGACGGETACSTCHVYVDAAFFSKLPEMAEAEEDMLDLAAGLKDNSRLGCQVYAAKELEGMIVTLPAEVNNMKQE